MENRWEISGVRTPDKTFGAAFATKPEVVMASEATRILRPASGEFLGRYFLYHGFQEFSMISWSPLVLSIRYSCEGGRGLQQWDDVIFVGECQANSHTVPFVRRSVAGWL